MIWVCLKMAYRQITKSTGLESHVPYQETVVILRYSGLYGYTQFSNGPLYCRSPEKYGSIEVCLDKKKAVWIRWVCTKVCHVDLVGNASSPSILNLN